MYSSILEIISLQYLLIHAEPIRKSLGTTTQKIIVDKF